MRNIWIIACSCILLLSLTSHPDQKLVGTWTEAWEEDIDYIDTVEIYLEDARLHMRCLTQPEYYYKKISFDGKKMKFTMVNPKDPNDVYEVSYSLKVNEKGDEMLGSAINNKNQRGKVTMHKIDLDS